MSKIGKLPIDIPEKVKVEINDGFVLVTGPKGELKINRPNSVLIEEKDNQLILSNKSKTKQSKADYGTTRAHLQNAVIGVTEGWSKVLELVGTGYRASVEGDELTVLIGFSHPVTLKAPEGISFKVEKTEITVDGIDRHLVGQVAAKIRSNRPPEPYKGKGIKYKDEVVRRKAGKAAKAAGAA